MVDRSASSLDLAAFHILVDLSRDLICIKDGERRWLLANTVCLRLFGLEGVKYQGKSGADLACTNDLSRRTLVAWEVSDERAWSKEVLDRSEEVFCLPDGSKKYYEVVRMPRFHPDGRRRYLITLGRDITRLKRAEMALRGESRRCLQLRRELQEKNAALEKIRTTLDVLLEHKESVQKEIEERIAGNIQERVLPYLQLLQTKLPASERQCVDVIINTINELGSTLVQDLKSPVLNLSAREIQVADLIRFGRTNKEIAEMLNVSVRSVESYRYSLRKKLGLCNTKINLRTYLISSFSSK
ncbi:LuxR C-terminal-related transcriptional regulator [Desulfolithobacter sp.]